MADRVLGLPGKDIWQRLADRRVQYRLLAAAFGILALVVALAGGYVIGTTGYGMVVVFGLIGVIVAVLIAIRPVLGVYILTVTVYLNLSDILETTLGIPNANKWLVALIALGVIANHIVLYRRPLALGRTQWLVIAYGFVLLIASLRADEQSIAVAQFTDWVKDFIILLIILQVTNTPRIWMRMQWVLILAAGLLAALSVYQILSGDVSNTFWGLAKAPVHEITSGFDSTRVTGPLDDPNFYAQILLMVFPLALYRFFEEPVASLRALGGGVAALIAAAAIFTYSRGALISLAVIGLLVIRERRWNPYKAALIIVVAVVVLVALFPVGYWDRFIQLGNLFTSDAGMQTESSLRGRSSEMIIAWRMFLDHPLLGVGPDNYAENYLNYSYLLGIDDRLQERQAHSLYLETAAELGLVGLFVLGALIVSTFGSLHSAKKMLKTCRRQELIPWVTGLQYGFTSYLITSIFLHGDYIRYFWFMLAAALSSEVVARILLQRYQARQEREAAERQGLFVTRETVRIS